MNKWPEPFGLSVLRDGEYLDFGFLTYKEMCLNWGQFAPQGTLGKFWRYFLLSQLSEGELLASRKVEVRDCH